MILLVSALLPVLGIVESTKETFVGSLAGRELVIRSDDSPAVCRGQLEMSGSYGASLLECSDGRTGRVTIHLAGGRGVAHGTLEGRPFTLTVG
jgi:hypothetical protein